jgi:hypothetical protein
MQKIAQLGSYLKERNAALFTIMPANLHFLEFSLPSLHDPFLVPAVRVIEEDDGAGVQARE